jgi:hypothetical protein
MTAALPRPGEVISYSYLWADEQEAGRQEGVKTRPCAVVMSLAGAGNTRIVALPITHTPGSWAGAERSPVPFQAGHAAATITRLGREGRIGYY